MPKTSKHKVLVVDDESSIRETLEHIFTSAGYDVATAKDGFDALLHLKRSVPEVVISDLNMPQMSGFEFLSVVRRRFPHVSVIASSGAYEHGGVPSGVIADAFYAKGEQNPEELLAIDSDIGVTGGCTSDRTGPGLDSAERKRLGRRPFHRNHVYRLSKVVSVACCGGGDGGGSRDSLPVLPQYGSLHHRLFSFRNVSRTSACQSKKLSPVAKWLRWLSSRSYRECENAVECGAASFACVDCGRFCRLSRPTCIDATAAMKPFALSVLASTPAR